MKEIDNKPKQWQLKKLGDIGEIVSGGTPSTKIHEFWNGNICWITPADLSGYKKKLISNGRSSLTEAGLKNSSARLIPSGSVLFSSRAPIGYVAIAANELCTNQGFKSVVPNKSIFSDYLYYYLFSAKDQAVKAASGTTFKEISLKAFSQLTIPVPPLPEQQAIVAKIEELFSDLENGKQQLLIAQQQLKVYRQSLLKWAFEGKLTNKNVKDGELPEGWKWVNLGELIKKIEAGKSFKCDERVPSDKEVGVLKVSAISWAKYNENESKTVVDSSRIIPEYFVNKGDFLFSRANTIELVGAVVLVHSVSKKLMLSDKTLRIIFNEMVLKEFILNYLRSGQGRNEIERLSTGNQLSMRNIGQERIRQIIIPYPPIEEQQLIVDDLESKLTVCDNIAETINQSLRQVETLKQSVLKKAFDGKLVK